MTEPELRAADLQQLIDQATAAVTDASPERWSASVPGDGRTVAAVARHIVLHLSLATFAAGVAKGERGPQATFTQEMLDGFNAAEAAKYADIPQSKVLEAIAAVAPGAVAALRALPPAAFEASTPMTIVGGTEITVREIVERLLLGGIREHLDAIGDAR